MHYTNNSQTAHKYQHKLQQLITVAYNSPYNQLSPCITHSIYNAL